MSLVTNLFAKIKADETVAGDLDTALSSFADSDPIPLASGTGSRQADLKFSDTITVDTGGTTLDLNALTDSLGRTINMVKVKAVRLKAADANTNTVVVGNGATSPFQGPFDTTTWTATLAAGAFIMFAAPVAGWACTGAAFDKLKFVGGAAGQLVDIQIIGTSV